MPAEYGIDPTGVGSALGLTKLANTAAINPVQQAATRNTGEFQKHSTEITVPAGEGLEYKFRALKGDTMIYAWQSGSSELFFDFHGEPKGDTTGYFQSYTVSTANKVRGSLTAPFEGSYGWYWENKGSSAVTVSLKIEGNFQLIGIK